MSDVLYKDRYRVPSARLKGWNYTASGYYFITIVTGNRQCYFGEIVQKEVNLSHIGKLVQNYWKQIPYHFTNTILDEYIIMPNHIHAIVIIKNQLNMHPSNGINAISGRDVAMQRLYKNMSYISPKPASIPTIIRSFKSISTREIRLQYNPSFAWQSRFYDRIIRTEDELWQIRKYIRDNPINSQSTS